MITILAIGKKHEGWVNMGVERYEKRLKKPFDVKWVLLPHSSKDGLEARRSESDLLLSRIMERDVVILLDEMGTMLDSPSLSTLLTKQFVDARNVVVVIGGAYGVDERIHARATVIWSLSKLVFPHQLVRLLLIEQIYRSQEIANGSSYHHV
jgi:23S rRNA (pseudouridine1915-N3)-methyltransferase